MATNGRREAAKALASDRRCGRSLSGGLRELVTSEGPPSNYQQAGPRLRSTTKGNSVWEGWPGTVVGHWIQQAATRGGRQGSTLCVPVRQANAPMELSRIRFLPPHDTVKLDHVVLANPQSLHLKTGQS